MDVKTNINASVNPNTNTSIPPPPVLPKKSESTSQSKEVVSLGKGKAAADGKDKSVETSKGKDAAEVQEILREALNVDPIPQRKLQLSIENELNIIVFKVFDKESGDLVRQIPMPEKIAISKTLRMAMEKMVDNQSGIAINEEV